uniref:Uncharacterized protein n=1 Tax=Panagrolaimus sp. JU765 TaxID=591449 RepID=A0AC34RK51_9BILA
MLNDLAYYFVESLESNGRKKVLEVTTIYIIENAADLIRRIKRNLPIVLMDCPNELFKFLNGETFDFVRGDKYFKVPPSQLSTTVFEALEFDVIRWEEFLKPNEIYESVKEIHFTEYFMSSYNFAEDYNLKNHFSIIKKYFPNVEKVFFTIIFYSKVSGDVYGFQKIRNNLLKAPQTSMFMKVFYFYAEPMTKCQLEDYLEKNMIRKKYNFWVEKTNPNKMIQLKCIYTQYYEHGMYISEEDGAMEERLMGFPVKIPNTPVWPDKIRYSDYFFFISQQKKPDNIN